MLEVLEYGCCLSKSSSEVLWELGSNKDQKLKVLQMLHSWNFARSRDSHRPVRKLEIATGSLYACFYERVPLNFQIVLFFGKKMSGLPELANQILETLTDIAISVFGPFSVSSIPDTGQLERQKKLFSVLCSELLETKNMPGSVRVQSLGQNACLERAILSIETDLQIFLDPLLMMLFSSDGKLCLERYFGKFGTLDLKSKVIIQLFVNNLCNEINYKGQKMILGSDMFVFRSKKSQNGKATGLIFASFCVNAFYIPGNSSYVMVCVSESETSEILTGVLEAIFGLKYLKANMSRDRIELMDQKLSDLLIALYAQSLESPDENLSHKKIAKLKHDWIMVLDALSYQIRENFDLSFVQMSKESLASMDSLDSLGSAGNVEAVSILERFIEDMEQFCWTILFKVSGEKKAHQTEMCHRFAGRLTSNQRFWQQLFFNSQNLTNGKISCALGVDFVKIIVYDDTTKKYFDYSMPKIDKNFTGKVQLLTDSILQYSSKNGILSKIQRDDNFLYSCLSFEKAGLLPKSKSASNIQRLLEKMFCNEPSRSLKKGSVLVVAVFPTTIHASNAYQQTRFIADRLKNCDMVINAGI